MAKAVKKLVKKRSPKRAKQSVPLPAAVAAGSTDKVAKPLSSANAPSRSGTSSDEKSSKAEADTLIDAMVICQAVGRKGEPVMLEKWRYDLLRQAILNVVPADDIGLMYKQLTPAVRANLSREDRKRIGQLHHDTTLVKLDLEYHGELERIVGMRPQYLRRVVKLPKPASNKKSAKRA